MRGQLNLAITGLTVLTFMTIHLFQFRLADIEQDWWPSWFIKLTFCRTDDGDVRFVLLTDIFGKGYKVLKHLVLLRFYIMVVVIFMTQACQRWRKVAQVPSPGISKQHQCSVKVHGY